MSALVHDPYIANSLIEDRRKKGLDGRDEVWEGMYVIMPNPNDEHQDLVGEIDMVLRITVQHPGLGKVRPGVNVSDRVDDWESNYRIPDLAVFLKEGAAECHDTFWLGGPDFGIEIVSSDDGTRQKLEFYAAVSTRELLIIDRDPWRLELHRLQRGKLRLVGRSSPDDPQELRSSALPLSWRLIDAQPRPQIQITHEDGRRWLV